MSNNSTIVNVFGISPSSLRRSCGHRILSCLLGLHTEPVHQLSKLVRVASILLDEVFGERAHLRIADLLGV